ncbi:MAG: helix-turn-helix domain-containing protein [Dehalococcoidia bacterium]
MAQPERVLLVSLGLAFAEVRRERGLTQEDLSLATGVHRNYIGGIERGERSPTVEKIATLARALGVSLSDLFARAEAR